MQAIVLASFYYGYITTTLLGGVLALQHGGKVLLLIAVLSTSLLTVITPALTLLGDYAAIIAVRVLEGIGQVALTSRTHTHRKRSCFPILVTERWARS